MNGIHHQLPLMIETPWMLKIAVRVYSIGVAEPHVETTARITVALQQIIERWIYILVEGSGRLNPMS